MERATKPGDTYRYPQKTCEHTASSTSVAHRMYAGLPVFIDGKRGTFQTDVVDDAAGPALPMLISKPTMKILKVKIDCETDQGTILGVTRKLDESSVGHYVVNLLDLPQDESLTRRRQGTAKANRSSSRQIRTPKLRPTQQSVQKSRHTRQTSLQHGQPRVRKLPNMYQDIKTRYEAPGVSPNRERLQ